MHELKADCPAGRQEPGQHTSDCAGEQDDDELAAAGQRVGLLDADVIFTAYRALGPGAAFVLVNDHDPLRYQFEAQYAGEFTWDYLLSGPAEWHVRIGRAAA